MKTLILLVTLLGGIQKNTKPKTVYICDSQKTTKYHLKNHCRGLSSCTHHIIAITLDEAKKRKLELCKFDR